jgi:DNA-binding NarL/FixJ family response regulator
MADLRHHPDADPPLTSSGPLPVRVHDTVPAYQAGLVSALRAVGYDAGPTGNPRSWAAQTGRRALLITIRTEGDWALLAGLPAANPDLVLLALLTEPTPATYQEAFRRGATAAVAWDASLATVLDVLAAAVNGRILLTSNDAHVVAAGTLTDPHPDQFSDQELDWLRQLATGVPVNTLARRSGLSDRSVYRRLANLYTRLGVANRSAAIATAIRWRLLDRRPN